MKKTSIILIVIVTSLILAWAVLALSTLLLPRENIATEIHLDDCRRLIVSSPEDLVYINALDITVISSMNRRDIPGNTGALYYIDNSLSIHNQRTHRIETDYPEYFRPHGLTVHTRGNDILLYVISHRLQGMKRHTIEVFSIEKKDNVLSVRHIETLWSPLLKNPNNCVAAPDGTLYISHDNFIDSGKTGGNLDTKLDYVFKRKRCPVTIYGRGSFYDSSYRITSGNGIAHMTAGKDEYLIHADAFANALNVLKIADDRNEKKSLHHQWTIALKEMPDNIIADGKGNFYVAVHYSLGLVLDHEKNNQILAPTMILRIRPDFSRRTETVSMVYADRGDEIPCGSVAGDIKGRLVMGQIFNDFILSCSM